MLFRIVDEKGKFVPEVTVKIVETDAAHEARRYLQPPLRLRGFPIRHGVFDTYDVLKFPEMTRKIFKDSKA